MPQHFQLEQLADGVYAAVAADTGAAGGNSGFVDLGDGLLIFDAMVTSMAVRDLIAAAQDITGHPLTAVINSHLHFDHILGNRAIPHGVDIIATTLTVDLIRERVIPFVEEQRKSLPEQVQALEAQLQAETDEEKGKSLSARLAMFRMILDEPHALEVRLPTRTFDERWVFDGSARSAELIPLRGHTESDSILYLPQDGIVFVGDLLFNGRHPWMLESDPTAWVQTLEYIEAMKPQIVVPGHGPVTDCTALSTLRGYILTLLDLAADLVARGGSPDDVTVPPAFAHLQPGQLFTDNLRHVVKRLTE